MKQNAPMRHEFVEVVPEPDDMKEGTLYVALTYATTVMHLCCCGCGREVVTPLSPTDWKVIFDGESISLCPSIGNWSFPCQSHYWISKGKVKWSGSWSKSEIAAGRARDANDKADYFEHSMVAETTSVEATKQDLSNQIAILNEKVTGRKGGRTDWWTKLKARFAVWQK